MAGSISGLASGLDTATIINQLMQLEQVPQARLQSRVSSEERQVSSLQTLNAKLASLASKAEEAMDPATWDGRTATSSDAKVTVSAGATAAPTSFSVSVRSTALTHQLGFATAHDPADVVLTGSTQVRLTRPDGSVADIETGDGTLQGVVDALNDPANETGVRANLVSDGTGAYRLLVESTASGAATDFTLTNADATGSQILGGATARDGRDASIDLGVGMVVTSATNTFTDVLPGVSVTIAAGTAVDTTSDISVARDEAAATKLVKDLVDGLNAALTEMTSLTSYGTNGKGAGLLAGDSTVRSVQNQLRSTIFGDSRSLAPLGIELDRDGKFTFDETVFKEAYADDPAAVVTSITTGFATRVHEVADGASNSTDGLLTNAITGRETAIERLNDSIDAWDNRLELRRTALTRQFTALEVALGQMSSQSNWLAGQIASLPTMSN